MRDAVYWSGTFVDCDVETIVDVSEHKGKKSYKLLEKERSERNMDLTEGKITVILEKEEVEMLIQAISCELSEMGTAGDSAGYEALQEKLERAIQQTET